MSSKSGIGDEKYLMKKIPQNPKYQHVKSRLNTGSSLTKYMERLEEIKKNYKFRKDELFKRLKVTTFAQLVLQVASVSELNENMNDETRQDDAADGDHLLELTSASSHSTPQQDQLTDSGTARHTPFSSRSTLQSVISGVGELSMDRDGLSSVTPPTALCATERPYPDCPYLLLDVRDQEQYNQCHIISARSFPITNLSRAMKPYTKEVLDYRNAAGKIIILYDEDERIASLAANTMCQRGFDNVFMLSGGLKVIAQRFPEGMTTGSIPASCVPEPTGPPTRKRAAPRQTLQPAENKQRFTPEDLDKIQHFLDELFVSSDTNSRLSSRMSVSTTASKISSARSSRLGSSNSRPQSQNPWK